MKETYDIPNVEIISTGEHQGHSFNEEAIERLLNDTNEVIESLRRRPFAHIGHTKFNERPDQLPRAANIPEMFYRGGKILAKFADIPRAIYRAMINGSLPKRSVELIQNYRDKITGKVYPWVIDSVALISTHPEVTDLNDYEKLYAAEDLQYVRICGTELSGWPAAWDERIKMGEEVKPATVETPKAEAPSAPEPVIQADEKAEALAALTLERDALKAELESLKAKDGENGKKIADLEKRLNEMAIDRELDALGTRLTPAEKAEEKIHLSELRALPNKVKFGEGEMTLYEKRLAELRKREPKIKMGEMIPEGDPEAGEAWDPERLRRAGLTMEKVENLRTLGYKL